MDKIKRTLTLALTSLFLALQAFAAPAASGTDNFDGVTGVTADVNAKAIANKIIALAIFIGVVCCILIIIKAAVKYGSGNHQAKEALKDAFVGCLITVLATTIVAVIVKVTGTTKVINDAIGTSSELKTYNLVLPDPYNEFRT